MRFLLLLCCLGLQAFADETPLDSEYLHQAPAGAFELTPGFGRAPGKTALTNLENRIRLLGNPNGISSDSISFNNSSAKFNFSAVPIDLGLEYGINSMFAVGLDLGYGIGNTSFSDCGTANCSPSHTISGLYNPMLYFKGRNDVGIGSLLYGVTFDFAVESYKVKASGDSNNATGGTTITPFIAYQVPVGPGILGARVQYDLYKGDQKTTVADSDGVDSTSTTKGGNSFGVDAFFEAPVGITTIGGSLFVISSPSTTSADAGATASSDGNAATLVGLQVYVPVHLSGGITLLPNVAYESIKYSSSNVSLSSAVGVQSGISVRLHF